MWRISSGMFRLVATFMATPFIISRLGDHDYGLLIALSVFVGYFATLDLDLGTAVSKYTAEFSASGQHAEMLRMVRTALSIFIAIGLAIAVLISLSSGWIVDRVIMVPAPQRDTAQMILILFAACFVFNMIAWIYGGVLAGLHRSDMLSWIGFAQVVVYFGVIVGLLLAGYGVFEVAAFQAIEPIYISLAFYWMARRASPSVSALPAFDPASARMLVKLSSVTMVGKIALGASRRLDTILIGAMGSLATIPYYTAPGLPVGIFIRLMVLFESLAIPLASELATREKDRSAALYLRATRLCALTSLLLALPLFIFATDLLFTWMGEVFAERGGGLLRVLLIGNLALVISSIGGAMLVGRGEASPYSISRP
ncbi:MAG: hypothetical protein FJX06_21230, partial [Alphaproteobacteria bacterium]|nr:hypothetical protein [Alphaproteobacteria bacterium]